MPLEKIIGADHEGMSYLVGQLLLTNGRMLQSLIATETTWTFRGICVSAPVGGLHVSISPQFQQLSLVLVLCFRRRTGTYSLLPPFCAGAFLSFCASNLASRSVLEVSVEISAFAQLNNQQTFLPVVRLSATKLSLGVSSPLLQMLEWKHVCSPCISIHSIRFKEKLAQATRALQKNKCDKKTLGS